jgi:hypothetical protein
MGASYAVVHRRAWTQQQLAQHPQTANWVWQLSDELAQIDIYEVHPPAPAPPTETPPDSDANGDANR